MNLGELLTRLLMAVITACIPILTGYAVSYVRQKAAVAAEKAESEMVREYINRITDAVLRAVTFVNQTYVDSLKASGEFTKEAQAEALGKALDAAITILGPEVMEWLEQAHEDVGAYLGILIEAAVKDKKTS